MLLGVAAREAAARGLKIHPLWSLYRSVHVCLACCMLCVLDLLCLLCLLCPLCRCSLRQCSIFTAPLLLPAPCSAHGPVFRVMLRVEQASTRAEAIAQQEHYGWVLHDGQSGEAHVVAWADLAAAAAAAAADRWGPPCAPGRSKPGSGSSVLCACVRGSLCLMRRWRGQGAACMDFWE